MIRFQGLGASTLLFAAFLIMAAPASAQDQNALGQYLERQARGCADMTYNAIYHLPRLISEDKPDSTRFLLNAWLETCERVEFLARAEVLVGIWDGELHEQDFDEEYHNLIYYYELHRLYRDDPQLNIDMWRAWEHEGIPRMELVAFDTFLGGFARSLIKEQEPGTTRHLLTRFYGDEVDDFYTELRRPEYKATRLRRAYDREVASLINPEYAYYGFAVGAWMPNGSLEKAGTKIPLSLVMGYRQNHWLGRLNLTIGPGKFNNEILVRHEGALYEAEDFVLYSAGLELGYSVVDQPSLKLDVLGSLAYTAAQWNKTTSSDDEGLFLSTLDLGLGLGLYRPLGELKDSSLGLEIWRRQVDFDTGVGGTDISGNAWTVGIIYSGVENNPRGRRLQQLGVDRWDY